MSLRDWYKKQKENRHCVCVRGEILKKKEHSQYFEINTNGKRRTENTVNAEVSFHVIKIKCHWETEKGSRWGSTHRLVHIESEISCHHGKVRKYQWKKSAGQAQSFKLHVISLSVRKHFVPLFLLWYRFKSLVTASSILNAQGHRIKWHAFEEQRSWREEALMALSQIFESEFWLSDLTAQGQRQVIRCTFRGRDKEERQNSLYTRDALSCSTRNHHEKGCAQTTAFHGQHKMLCISNNKTIHLLLDTSRNFLISRDISI